MKFIQNKIYFKLLLFQYYFYNCMIFTVRNTNNESFRRDVKME
jgi:hypothetical protein